MSKINQIENKIRELDGGAFQKLADGYLRKKGYKRLNPIGSVIGSNKVRMGTPDTFIALDNGKYVFCEHTTQTDGLFEKLKSDITKCFDSKKTRIPVKRIEEIVICHTSLLDPADEHELREMCRKRRVNFNIFGLGPLSYDLLEHYPKLAQDHLGIEVDTGQIVSPEDFVSAYNKGALATPLDTVFHFREEEVQKTLLALEQSDLVIITGRPGVGKTRHALACCSTFGELHPEYEVRCVFNRGPDLFQDLLFHFSAPKHHLIFVDDANRVNRFEYALQLLHKQEGQRRVKIVATVRDYALEGIRELARPFGGGAEIDLEVFSDDQIKKFIESQFCILNHRFLDRIAEVSRGNPRIAIMAAQVANRENTLYALRDLSSLYDEYYRSITRDFQDIGKKDLLKAAGILVFFRVVDRSYSGLMQQIQTAFEITPEAFWEAVHRLHALEAVDLYEDEVVRVSDQVLATYLFYLAVFRERKLSFSSILTHFFPQGLSRIVDALNPILNVFGTLTIMEALRPHVDEAWKRLEASGNQNDLLQLMQLFWPLKETEILIYVREQVARMETEPVDVDSLETKPDTEIPNPSLLSLLSILNGSRIETIKIVLAILLDLLSRRARELPRVVHILEDRFGFKHTSGLQDFDVQQSVIDCLWERTKDGEDPLFVKLFLKIAGNYLQTHFHNTEQKDGNAYTIYQFDLPYSPPIVALRKTIWARLFQLYRTQAHRDGVFTVLEAYHPYSQSGSVSEIIAVDYAEVCTFFQEELDPSVFGHCRVVHGFLSRLEFHGIPDAGDLRNRFRSEAFDLYEILAENMSSPRALRLGYIQFEEDKKRRLISRFQDLNPPDYGRVFSLCLEILNDLTDSRDKQLFMTGLLQALLHIADRSPTLFSQVIEDYLNEGNLLHLRSSDASSLSAKLVQVCGIERTEEILRVPDYTARGSWLFGFFYALPPEVVSPAHLDEICRLYQEAPLADLPCHMDYLLKFIQVDERAVTRVVHIVLDRARQEVRISQILSCLFNPGTILNRSLTSLFRSEPVLLQELYILLSNADSHVDYDGTSLNMILDLDHTFIIAWLQNRYNQKDWLSVHDFHPGYTLMWRRDDCEELLSSVADFIFERERRTDWHFSHFGAFFIRKPEEQLDEHIQQRQDRFLSKLIEQRCDDRDFMRFLFCPISSFNPERRLQFITLFIHRNKKFDDFRNLPLEPSSWSASGSLVPVFHAKLTFFESLIPILNSIDYLPHKHYIETCIYSLRRQIDAEKKRDFIGH